MSEEKESSERGYAENIAHQAGKTVVNTATAAAEGDALATVGNAIAGAVKTAGAVLGMGRDS